MDSIVDIINETVHKNYRRNLKKTVAQRYKGMNEGMDKILQVVKDNYGSEANKYFEKREKKNKMLLKIQTKSQKNIDKCLKQIPNITYKIIPASSFSAGTNLMEESDIDFAVLIKNITSDKVIHISNYLGVCSYLFTDIRNIDDKKLKHWVFQKYIDDVEIEAKVRDMDGFEKLSKVHHYLDNVMSKDKKKLITYTKYLLRNNKEIYGKFKMMYYSMAGYHSKINELLYSLV